MPSSTIARFEYDPETRTLSIWFVANGRQYDYIGVPAEVAEEFRNAFSKGRYFNSRIRDHYPSEWRAWEAPITVETEPAAEPSASNVIPFPGHRRRS